MKINKYSAITKENNLCMLDLISCDDQELYIINRMVDAVVPKNKGDLYHHPLHSKAIKDKVEEVGAKGICNSKVKYKYIKWRKYYSIYN